MWSETTIISLASLLVLLLQTAPELLEKDLHGESQVQLFVVEPVNVEGSGLLVIGTTQGWYGGQQRNVWNTPDHKPLDKYISELACVIDEM